MNKSQFCDRQSVKTDTPSVDSNERESRDDCASPTSPDRRAFLGKIGGAAATIAAGAAFQSKNAEARAQEIEPQVEPLAEVGPQSARKRAKRAYNLREEAARNQRDLPLPAHPTNGDEERFLNKIASYSKALPHNALGEVDLNAYAALVRAMSTGQPADFAALPTGGPVRLGNPQAALAFEMEGADSHHLAVPAPPSFSSEAMAGEMAEVYWQAITHDVPFSQYGTEPLTIAAAGDLSRFSNFANVTAANLFRGNTAGDLKGSYISQFLWKDIPFGPKAVDQKYRTGLPGVDYMTTYDEWLNIQNGVRSSAIDQIDPTLRYIRNNRDLAAYLRFDFSYQAFMNAALILLSFGAAALDDANPYKTSPNQGGFVTFGGPHILDMAAKTANSALKATWYQKWSVHRSLRPEAFAGRVHNHKTGAASYPINSKLLDSQAVATVFEKNGTYLLPSAYPEGSPTHPSYPAGHAAIAGAGVTVLKAFFKESFVIPNPVVATDDGLALVPFDGALTVGDELNKLAANISLGRGAAGVHFRADGIQGMNLGEAVAISIMRDMKLCFTETFNGFSLTKFDGTTITI